MIDPDVTRRVHAMFDAHSAAFAALRRANTAMGEATQARDAAIQAALAANQTAIDVLHALSKNQDGGQPG
jgi:hypothetical protein